MSKSQIPKGWNQELVSNVLAHYEAQTDDEAVAEDEAAYEAITSTSMNVPVDLVPKVRELIANRKAG
jgi:hypothetical protein